MLHRTNHLSDPLTRRASLLLGLLFLLALAPRAARLWQGRAAPLSGDAIEYHSLGRSLAQGRGYLGQGGNPMIVANAPEPTAFRTPTLPLFVAAHEWVRARARIGAAGDDDHALWPRASLVLLNAAAAPLLVLALRRRRGADPRVPWLSGLLFALWPESLASFYQSDLLLAESLALPLLVGLIYLQGREGRGARLACGVILGALILLRAFLVLLVPLLLLTALAAGRRDLLRRTLAAGAVAAVLVLPWSLRNQALFGRPVPLSTQQGVSLWFGWNEDARGSWSALWDHQPAFQRVLRRHPELPSLPEPGRSAVFLEAAREATARRGVAGNLALLGKKLLLFASPRDATGWHLELLLGLPLAALGLVRVLRRGAQPDAVDQLLLALGGNAVLVVALVFMDQRFRYLALPATLTFCAEGLCWLWRRRSGDDAGAGG